MRDPLVRVPADVLVGLVNKFEAPNEEVLKYVDEIIEVEW